MMRPGLGALLQDVEEDHAVRFAPGVFPIGCLVGIVGKVQVAELVNLAVLHPAEAGEIGFGKVVCRAVVRPVFVLMVHPAGVEFGMQGIVSVRLVGADRGPFRHESVGELHYIALVLVLQHEGQRLLRACGQLLALLPHDEDATLARLLMLRQATVNAVSLLVLRADMAVHVSAVHVDLAGKRFDHALLDQGFTDLVREHKSGLVLDAQIAGELQGRNALRSICENGDRRQVDPQWQLVEGEDRSRCHRKGMVAGFAAPLLAGRQEVMLIDRAACRTGGFLAFAPTHFPENREGFLVRHLEHLPDREGPGAGREKEVLGHCFLSIQSR